MSNIHERMENAMQSLIDEELSKFQGTWMQVGCKRPPTSPSLSF